MAKLKSHEAVELPAIPETTKDYEAIEAKIRRVFLEEVYRPIIDILNPPKKSKLLKNSIEDDLYEALRTGQVTFHRGVFSGRFDANISRALKKLGAKFDRTSGTFRISASDLPYFVRSQIASSQDAFERKIRAIDEKLAQVSPEALAGKINITDHFDRALFKVEKQFQKNVRKITITPEIPAPVRKKIARQWQSNMDLWIKDFTEQEIKNLRSKMFDSIMVGNRYDAAAKVIKDSFGVTERKAKFLARQETHLMMTTWQESRYKEAGIQQYKWQCVAGTPLHPVRPAHKALDGKVFRFDDPPMTTGPGEPVRRNNPGQDYNCFVGSTSIGFIGDCSVAFGRSYSGKVIDLRLEDGRSVKATPNHPILTTRGWVPVQSLQESDEVLSVVIRDFGWSLRHEIDGHMPVANQIFDLLSVSGTFDRVIGEEHQFHKDGTDSEVRIVRMDGGLLDDRKTGSTQENHQVILSSANLATYSFPGFGAFDPFIQALPSSSHSFMRFPGLIEPLRQAHTRPLELLALRLIPELFSKLNQVPLNHAPTSGESLGKAVDALSRAIERGYFTDRKAYFIPGCGLALEANKIHGLRSSFDTVQVYNFETHSGLYAANGIIASNCRCVARPIVKIKS